MRGFGFPAACQCHGAAGGSEGAATRFESKTDSCKFVTTKINTKSLAKSLVTCSTNSHIRTTDYELNTALWGTSAMVGQAGQHATAV